MDGKYSRIKMKTFFLWSETTYYLSGRCASEKLCLLGKILVYFISFFCYKPHVTHRCGIKSVFFFTLSLYTESLWTWMFRKLQMWKWSSVQSKEWTMHLSGWLDGAELPRRYIYHHCFICYHSSVFFYMLSVIILLTFLKFTTGNVLFVPSPQAASLPPVNSTPEGSHNTVLQYDNRKTCPVMLI